MSAIKGRLFLDDVFFQRHQQRGKSFCSFSGTNLFAKIASERSQSAGDAGSRHARSYSRINKPPGQFPPTPNPTAFEKP